MDRKTAAPLITKRNWTVQQNLRLHKHQFATIAKCNYNRRETIAMRLRTGEHGYAEYINELNVYLMPNFGHVNVLPYVTHDKRLYERDDKTIFTSRDVLKQFDDSYDSQDDPSDDDDDYDMDEDIYRFPLEHKGVGENMDKVSTSNGLHLPGVKGSAEQVEGSTSKVDERAKKKKKLNSGGKVRKRRAGLMEYWIINEFDGCITLRHFLMMETITWPVLLHILTGILNGLHFLHDNEEYRDIDIDEKIDEFIKNSHGALKRVYFRNHHGNLVMKPLYKVAIIHRNLTSLNIVLKPDMTPCIWDFGCAFVHPPFQPISSIYTVAKPIKRIHMTSFYSPPEVLNERAHMTLNSLKSIDMYACGIICWELMSRCNLPQLNFATSSEIEERHNPDNYCLPLEKELQTSDPDPRMLKYVVCTKRVRPSIKMGWRAGYKTGLICQLMRELWDHDSEARLQVLSAIGRVARIDRSDSDHRDVYPYAFERNRFFNISEEWPPTIKVTQAPLIKTYCNPNIVIEDIANEQPPSRASSACDEGTGRLISGGFPLFRMRRTTHLPVQPERPSQST